MIQVKTSQEFLGVPAGSRGTVLLQNGEVLSAKKSVQIKFDCKDEPVQAGYPNSHYSVLGKDNES